MLKDKFKGFNTELEELLKVQKEWSLPDPVLRSRVRNDNIEVIVPLYSTFHQM
jgi:exocyst complex protein 7